MDRPRPNPAEIAAAAAARKNVLPVQNQPSRFLPITTTREPETGPASERSSGQPRMLGGTADTVPQQRFIRTANQEPEQGRIQPVHIKKQQAEVPDDANQKGPLRKSPVPRTEHFDTGVGPAEGKEATWQSIIDHMPMAQALADRILRQNGYAPMQAEDIVQDAIAQMMEKGLDDIEKPGSYLIVTSMRRALRVTRRHRHEVPVDPQEDDSEMPPGHHNRSETIVYNAAHSDAPNPADETVDADEKRRLRAAIDELDGKQKEVVEGILQGTPYTELSESLDMPIGSIGPTLTRAAAKLKAKLEGRNKVPTKNIVTHAAASSPPIPASQTVTQEFAGVQAEGEVGMQATEPFPQITVLRRRDLSQKTERAFALLAQTGRPILISGEEGPEALIQSVDATNDEPPYTRQDSINIPITVVNQDASRCLELLKHAGKTGVITKNRQPMATITMLDTDIIDAKVAALLKSFPGFKSPALPDIVAPADLQDPYTQALALFAEQQRLTDLHGPDDPAVQQFVTGAFAKLKELAEGDPGLKAMLDKVLARVGFQFKDEAHEWLDGQEPHLELVYEKLT